MVVDVEIVGVGVGMATLLYSDCVKGAKKRALLTVVMKKKRTTALTRMMTTKRRMLRKSTTTKRAESRTRQAKNLAPKKMTRKSLPSSAAVAVAAAHLLKLKIMMKTTRATMSQTLKAVANLPLKERPHQKV